MQHWSIIPQPSMNRPITASLLPRQIRQICSEVYFLPISFKIFCIFLFFLFEPFLQKNRSNHWKYYILWKRNDSRSWTFQKECSKHRPSFIMARVPNMDPALFIFLRGVAISPKIAPGLLSSATTTDSRNIARTDIHFFGGFCYRGESPNNCLRLQIYHLNFFTFCQGTFLDSAFRTTCPSTSVSDCCLIFILTIRALPVDFNVRIRKNSKRC